MLMESMVAASTARHRPGHRAVADARGERFAALRRQQLAVVEPAYGPVGREDHGGRYHRPEQRAAANFIHARHAAKAARAQFALDGGFTTDFATRRVGPHGF